MCICNIEICIYIIFKYIYICSNYLCIYICTEVYTIHMLSYVYNYLTDGFPPHSRKLNSVGITIPFLALNMCETTKPVYKHPWLVVVLYMWTMSRNHIPIFHTTITRHPKDWLLKSLQHLPCCLNPHSLPSFLPSGIMDRSLQLRHTSFWSWGLIDSKSRFRVWCTSQDGRVMAIPGTQQILRQLPRR